MAKKRSSSARTRSSSRNRSASSVPWSKIVMAFVVAVLAALGYQTYQNDHADTTDTTPNTTPNTSQPPTTTTPNEQQPTQLPAPQPSSNNNNKTELSVVSWNVYNFGGGKSDEALQMIADLVRPFDVVALQEVSLSADGAQAVAYLVELLNRRGNQWDYVISDRTSGEGSERYAYLWKTSRTSLSGKPFLTKAQQLDDRLDREPYMARFTLGKGGKETATVMVANFHAVPTSKKPANEAILLASLHDAYAAERLLIVGDFNLSQQNQAFKPLKAMGYEAALVDQKTSIRLTKLDGDYLSQAYDNLFYETNSLRLTQSGVVDFVPQLKSLADAREISDHLPVWAKWQAK